MCRLLQLVGVHLRIIVSAGELGHAPEERVGIVIQFVVLLRQREHVAHLVRDIDLVDLNVIAGHVERRGRDDLFRDDTEQFFLPAARQCGDGVRVATRGPAQFTLRIMHLGPGAPGEQGEQLVPEADPRQAQ